MSDIRYLPIYSLQQRIAHWLIAAGFGFEWLSAWLVDHSDVDPLVWSDWHLMVGQALLLVLAWRLLLFFLPGSGHWRFFVPTREQRHIVRDTLRFYASLGKAPLPDWYAFNPVWQPLYLLMILLAVVTVISGFFHSGLPFAGELSAADLHAGASSLLLWLALAHVAVAIWHDARGRGAQISGMLNGHKYFHIGDPQGNTEPAENSVRLDSLTGKATDK